MGRMIRVNLIDYLYQSFSFLLGTGVWYPVLQPLLVLVSSTTALSELATHVCTAVIRL